MNWISGRKKQATKHTADAKQKALLDKWGSDRHRRAIQERQGMSAEQRMRSVMLDILVESGADQFTDETGERDKLLLAERRSSAAASINNREAGSSSTTSSNSGNTTISLVEKLECVRRWSHPDNTGSKDDQTLDTRIHQSSANSPHSSTSDQNQAVLATESNSSAITSKDDINSNTTDQDQNDLALKRPLVACVSQSQDSAGQEVQDDETQMQKSDVKRLKKQPVIPPLKKFKVPHTVGIPKAGADHLYRGSATSINGTARKSGETVCCQLVK